VKKEVLAAYMLIKKGSALALPSTDRIFVAQTHEMLRLEDLAELVHENSDALKSTVKSFKIGGHLFDFKSGPYLMGVVNLSPDSWYRESVCLSTESAVQRGLTLKAQGASLVDIGAESSVLDSGRVESNLQESRLLPAVCSLSSQKVLISAETYLPDVARSCLESGASVLNMTGTQHANAIYTLAAEYNAAVIICYVQGPNVREVGDLEFSDDPIEIMKEFFAREIDVAVKAGVTRIIIDPGLGFYYRNLKDSGERVRHQMRTFLNTFRLRSLGWPVCHALPHAFEYFKEEVRCSEPFFTVMAALGKTDLYRTHEVSRVRAVLETMGVWGI